MDQFKLRFIKFLRINAVGNELLDGSRESSSVPSKVNISAVSRGGEGGRGRGQQKRGKRKAKFFDQKFQRLLYIKLGNKTRLLPFRVFHSQDSQQFSRPAPSISMGGGSGERSNANRFNIVSRARRKITNVRFRFSFEETWKKEEGEGKLVEETIFPPFSYL